jgi:glucose-1-phosphate cytidylyltransferase
MKVLLLAGGFGTRLGEETDVKPKPMVEIGGKPILWHIMKIYSQFGYNDFIVLLGYKGFIIKEYFANYFLHQKDVTIDLSNNNIDIHDSGSEPWRIRLMDTGESSMTGGRVKRAQHLVGDKTFMLTYGDGLSNIDMISQLKFHRTHGKAITMASVQPEGLFGTFEAMENGIVTNFLEKPKGEGSWVNGGFFICEPRVFDYIVGGDTIVFEHQPLQNLARGGELVSYNHHGFWKCMDTLRDKKELNDLWVSGKAPWKIW